MFDKLCKKMKSQNAPGSTKSLPPISLSKFQDYSTVSLTDSCGVQAKKLVSEDHAHLLDAMAIKMSQMMDDKAQLPAKPCSLLVFCERLRPLTKETRRMNATGGNHFDSCPSVDAIYQFVESLVANLAMGPEVSLAAMEYIIRFCQKGGLPFAPSTWKRTTLFCYLTALKMWEDQNFFNEDAVKYLGFDNLLIRDVAVMERRGLRHLDYTLHITEEDATILYNKLSSLSDAVRQREAQKLGSRQIVTRRKSVIASWESSVCQVVASSLRQISLFA